MKIKRIIISLVLLGAMWFSGCGDPSMDMTDVTYEPKLVVEGYLFSGQPVTGIRVMRNFGLGTPIDTTSLYIADARVTVNGAVLKYNPVGHFFYHDTMIARPGTSYNIQVSGTVAGKFISTSASTTVPEGKYQILHKDLGSHTYDDSIYVAILPTCTAEFYAFSIIPLTATVDNFAFENPFVGKQTRDDIIKNLNRYKYQMNILLNVQKNSTELIKQSIKAFDAWFYSQYRVIVYGGDTNFKNYLLSKNVEEFDGNFHEPRQPLSGDGIGVFASAVIDTVTFEIRK
ncbi:MAG: DUF4249 domain-containing protein [Ignavibacteria bacterium]|nr:DUF4249 domain-containing protein [Ignavibacteria bacterium]